jgi:F0F1-type ATP synthase membrane subunit b/b'
VQVWPNYSLLLVMACFWVVYVLVSTQLVRPLGDLLDEREKRVRSAREAFEQAQGTLADTMARCAAALSAAASEGQRERASLRSAGEAARRARLEGARAQAHERLNRLAAELEEAARAARATLRSRATELARELASRLIGRSVA